MKKNAEFSRREWVGEKYGFPVVYIMFLARDMGPQGCH